MFDVPGAFEMPLLSRDLAATGRYAAVVAAAFVVDGGIYRHEFVAQAVVDGLMRAGMDTGVPVLSVSLTPHQYQETEHHKQIYRAHFVEKGREAAKAALTIGKTGPLSPRESGSTSRGTQEMKTAGHSRRRPHQIDFTSPPSMRSVEPVIQRAPGDTRKAISSAISSGSP